MPFRLLLFVLLVLKAEAAQWTNNTSGKIINHDFDVSSEKCPTWYVSAENATKLCICGSELNGKLKCLENGSVSVLVGSCLTYTDEGLLLGICPYVPSDSKLLKDVYITFPRDVEDVENFMCGSLNRTGLLCSECQEGLSLAPMSYQRECVACSSPGRGVVLFIALAFIPTTIFFLVVMACSIDISSGPMNAYLVIVQVSLAKINQSPSKFIFKSDNPLSFYFTIFLASFHGIWNLDFLRFIIPPFCISISLTTLQAEALEYVIATYPLLLIVLTFICVELYDRDYKIMVALWVPCRRILRASIFKDLNIKYSLLKAFATFLLLAYTKIFHISRALLNYTEVWNSSGGIVKSVIAIDASTSYCSSAHIPYMVLAIVMLVTFNLLPLFLLFFYPMKWFQLLLGKFPGVNWHPLHAFMDIFQGCYKNGTNGTVDARYFAALNLIIRIASLFPIDDQGRSIVRLFVLSMVFIALVAIVRPYQRNIYNIWEIFIYNVFMFVDVWVLLSTYINHYSLEVIYLSQILLFSYTCFVYAVKVLKILSPRCYRLCVEKVRKLTEKACSLKVDEAAAIAMKRGEIVLPAQDEDEEFPDRVNNPRDYDSLLPRFECSPVPTYGIRPSS